MKYIREVGGFDYVNFPLIEMPDGSDSRDPEWEYFRVFKRIQIHKSIWTTRYEIFIRPISFFKVYD